MNTPELNEQIALFRFRDLFARQYPALRWLHASLNGVHLSPLQSRKAAASGMTAGIPDVFLPVPISFGESQIRRHGLYMEMKVPPNTLTVEQAAFFDAARAQGYRCEVAYSWIEAANILLDYLSIEDERLRDYLKMNEKPVRKPSARPRKKERTQVAER